MYSYNPRAALRHAATSPSPLRHASTASSNSSDYSNNSNPYPPSQSSTVSSNESNGYGYEQSRHKRGLSEITSPQKEHFTSSGYTSAANAYQNARQSLRPLPQTPATSPSGPEKRHSLQHVRAHSVDDFLKLDYDGSTSPPAKQPRPSSQAISRSDSVRGRGNTPNDRASGHHVHFMPHLDRPDLQNFQKSSTGHLRTLSRFADAVDEDFSIKSPEQEVVGLHGRRRLQRGNSVRAKKTTTGWAGRTWMDQQRQFLQAYEYLCHIGEAKEWIEDVIQKPIPPIVELEEALRDGVTLAEVVQALYPERPLRIFRNPKLQFRHSDNIAIFFRFLQEVELPDLFWFELVDLYDKKNIPKVIYCIHALSWLLFRKGIVDFRIGNLVGQLQFEDHELEAMQKGLDKAGISMPNFSGMGASFGAEPLETEDERIDRELAENETTIADFQAQIRGAMVRLRLGDVMQNLWDAEGWIVDLQARIRGDFARQIAQYRLDMRKFAVNLQSAARGFLVRSGMRAEENYWQDREGQVVLLQSLLRGRRARAGTQFLQTRVQRHEHGIKQLQAAIRGALKRRDVGDELAYAQDAEPVVRDLQAVIRGTLARRRVGEQLEHITHTENQVEKLQAAVRGMLQRRTMQTEQAHLKREESTITKLQAAVRGAIVRRHHNEIHRSLQSMTAQWQELQSAARGIAVRKHIQEVSKTLNFTNHSISALQAVARGRRQRSLLTTIVSPPEGRLSIILLQARIRAFEIRRNYLTLLKAVRRASPNIVELQSAARGFIQRQRTFDLLCMLNDHEDTLIALQSLIRGLLCRSVIGNDLMQLEDAEDAIIELQAIIRGKLVRSRFAEKMKFFKENMQKVIKIQSFVRAKQQGQAYKMLTSGKNPPVGTIKNFVHLLNDSNFDFEEEIEFERLRKTVVQHVRQNELAEQYIDQLDIKIALLVKNKITLDEVVKHQKHFGGHVGSLLSNKEISSKDPFDLKALNKNSRKKLEHYQELFFILQTQPQYLARLFRKLREQGLAESDSKKVELLMMGIFGFAQKRREEYYLIKLISRAIKEEIDTCASLQDYLRGNFFWGKILSSYLRSPRDRKYLRDLLSPVVKEEIMQNEGLDLESDPMQIYRSAINNEELRTGQRSRRRADIPREEAIRDPETRETFIKHLQDLRDIADRFLLSLEDTLTKMPYGVRYVAQQTFYLLCTKFPHEAQPHLLTLVGHWLWKTYIQPALMQPDTWGVVDRGLSPMQKRNLGEVAKVVGQITAGRLFGGENVYLQPINPYISEALARMEEIWSNLINVRATEEQFDIDEFNDLYSRTKPTMYMKLADIFAIHQMVAQDISVLCPNQDDILREVIRELGSAKNNENDMLHVSSTEITLTLNPKLHNAEDPDAAVKSLFMETKRCVLYIIRVQQGPNLLDIMVRPITTDDEDKWAALVHDELAQERRNPKKRANPYADSSSHLDITTLSYTELKRAALENILRLEKTGRITRANHYQDLLNEIALDIRTKHRRRIQRSREMDNVRATLSALQEKAKWLDSQLKSYNDYIEQAMVTLQQKAKGKKRFLLPFTKQYNHERELQRSGRVPRFGSFKYSARNLADKGVLVAWRGYTERQWDKINVTISSDEVGVFYIEGSVGSMMIPGAAASVPLDDLLQAQFNNCQFMNLFGDEAGGEGALRLNVNLLVHLLMRKFYRDE